MNEIINILTSPMLFIFAGIQLLTVMISTFKSIMTVNGSKRDAAITNALSFTFGAIITKIITTQTFYVVIIVTFFMNILGVYIAKYIIDKRKPEKLWTVNATIYKLDPLYIEDKLKKRNIEYVLFEAKNNRHTFTIFCYSKAESLLVKEILDEYKVNNYHIIISRDNF